MDDPEKRNKRITAIGEIYNAGFEILRRHSSTVEPMLMGGLEYIARRGSYLLAYNISEENICLQKNRFQLYSDNGLCTSSRESHMSIFGKF